MSYTGLQSDDGADRAVGKRIIALTIVTVLCAVFGANGFARAGGLLMSSEPQHTVGDYTVLTLTEEQDQEVQRKRLFTPTAEQLALLRRIEPSCPPKLQVITPWFNDCGCGMHGYVMWFRPGEVEAPIDAISRWPLAAPGRNDLFSLRDDAALGDTTAVNLLLGRAPEAVKADSLISQRALGELVMDLDGNLYCDGDSVGTEEILALVDHRNAERARRGQEDAALRVEDSYWERPCLWLHMPPLDMRARHTDLFNGLLGLAVALASRGWQLRLAG